MADSRIYALIGEEAKGELTGLRRGELARCVLADPDLRVLREDFQRLCAALEKLEDIEPPPELRESILDALPQSTAGPARSWWSGPRMRYAALIAGVLIAGTVVYESLHGLRPSPSDVAGTMAPADAPTTVDTVRLDNGVVLGRVSLYRDRRELGLRFEVSAGAPVDVLVASDGHTLRINDVASQDKPGQGKPGVLTVGMPGLRMGGQTVNLSFLVAGRQEGEIHR